MLRWLIAAFWTSILAYDAQLPQATWENYLDQAIELQNAGRLAEAEVAYVSTMQEAERLGSEDPAVARVYMNLGRLRTLQHDYSAARLALERSLNITEKTFRPDHFTVGLLLTNIAMIYHQQGQYSQAEPLYRRALSVLEAALGPTNRFTALAEIGMAKLLLAQQRNTEAESLVEKAIPTLESSRELDDQSLAIALISLAEAYRIDGRYARAEPVYRRALAMVEAKPALRTDEISFGLSRFPPMLRKLKRKSEARELDIQIKSILPE